MALPLRFNNTVYQSGFAGTDDGAPSASFQVDEATTNPITVNGTVSAVGDPITVTGILPGSTASTTTTFYATQYDNGSMIQFTDTQTGANASSTRLILSNSQVFGTGSPARTRFTADANGTPGDYAAPCYVTGTQILTARGEVAVEALAVGDLVITASGQHRPIIWIGQRHLDFSTQSEALDAQPIRIRTSAVAPRVPSRDLLVSPDHSLFFDDVFVPAKHLVNGASITRESFTTVTYWHVELDTHDVLLANGMPAESYLDVGNRRGFENGHGLNSGSARREQDFCAPVVRGGDQLLSLRTWLIGRSQHLGWKITLDPNIELLADGVQVKPTSSQDEHYSFDVPHGTNELRLVSRSGVLSEVLADHSDTRRLGVMLTYLSLDGQAVQLNDESLAEGFHNYEPSASWRWTNGDASVPVAKSVELTAKPAVYILENPRVPPEEIQNISLFRLVS